jgi:hypothetical protein
MEPINRTVLERGRAPVSQIPADLAEQVKILNDAAQLDNLGTWGPSLLPFGICKNKKMR